LEPLCAQSGLWVWFGLQLSSAIHGEKRVVRRLLSGVIPIGAGRRPVPCHGVNNLDFPNGNTQGPWGKANPVMKRKGGQGEKGKAGKDASASMTAFSCVERLTRPVVSQPEGVSCHNGNNRSSCSWSSRSANPRR